VHLQSTVILRIPTNFRRRSGSGPLTSLAFEADGRGRLVVLLGVGRSPPAGRTMCWDTGLGARRWLPQIEEGVRDDGWGCL
jgi:hypothetical protein